MLNIEVSSMKLNNFYIKYFFTCTKVRKIIVHMVHLNQTHYIFRLIKRHKACVNEKLLLLLVAIMRSSRPKI